MIPLGRALLGVLFLLFLGSVSLAQTSVPTYANNGSSCSSSQSAEKSRYTCPLPNATSAGNAVVVFAQWNSGGTTASVTDDRGNAYTRVACSAGAQNVCGYVALNVVAGARKIIINATSQVNYFSAAAYEFYNVASANAIDGSCTASNTGTSVRCNSPINTTANNDLIVFWATQDASGDTQTTWLPGGSPWVLRTADSLDQTGMEYQVQPTAGSITPTMTISPGNQFDGVAFALKAASAGTPPPSSGIRASYLQNYDFRAYINGCFGSPCTGSVTVQFPCSGNLALASWIGVHGYNILSLTSNPANNWISTGGPFGGDGSSGDSQLYYAASPACAPNAKLTLKLGTTDDINGSTLQLMDVVGADPTSPFDTTAGIVSCTGHQVNVGTFTGCTITPGATNELIMTQTGVYTNTLNNVSPGNFLSAVSTPIVSPDPVNENNGWALAYNGSSLAPITFQWTSQDGGVGGWTSLAAAFKSGSSGAGDPPPSPPPDTTPPTVPTSLSATAQSSSTIALAWSASTDNVGVAGYRLYRDGSQITTTANRSFTDSGLAAATTHTYAVAAFDAAGNTSNQSNTATATTFAAADTTPPTVPSNLSATAQSSSTIALAWNASTDNVAVTGYRVYRDGSQITTTANRSFTDSGLTAATTHTYAVAAFDAAGNTSNQSSTATATTLPASGGGTGGTGTTALFVQGIGIAPNSGSPLSVTFAAVPAAGNLIIAGGSWGTGSGNMTCSDTAGTVFVNVPALHDTNNNQSQQICYGVYNNSTATSDTVRISFPNSGYTMMFANEYTGLATTNPLDVYSNRNASGCGTSNCVTSGTVSTSQADLIIAVGQDDSGQGTNISAGTGFTQRMFKPGYSFLVQDVTKTASGSAAATFTFSAPNRYLVNMAAFKLKQ